MSIPVKSFFHPSSFFRAFWDSSEKDTEAQFGWTLQRRFVDVVEEGTQKVGVTEEAEFWLGLSSTLITYYLKSCLSMQGKRHSR